MRREYFSIIFSIILTFFIMLTFGFFSLAGASVPEIYFTTPDMGGIAADFQVRIEELGLESKPKISLNAEAPYIMNFNDSTSSARAVYAQALYPYVTDLQTDIKIPPGTIPTVPTSQMCNIKFPPPELVLKGTEEIISLGQQLIKYNLSVTNRSAYPNELFAAIPTLPFCRGISIASRTWVEIFAKDGTRFQGYCDLRSPDDLDRLWFAIPKGQTTPECVFIRLTDKLCNNTYESNCAPIGSGTQPFNCYPDLPAPELIIKGTEDSGIPGRESTRYLLSVTNRSAYPDEMFALVPDLPPCGNNQNATRTWVEVFAKDGTRFTGFCTLTSSEDLDKLFFDLEKSLSPPECVYIRLTDMLCKITSESNCASIGPAVKPSNCDLNLPSPELIIKGTEDYGIPGKESTKYLLSVVNRSAYPDEMFADAPDLPPCGNNQNASRTWVDIYTKDGDRIYGFCDLTYAEDLDNLWFTVEKGVAPPECVYITLTDRRCDRTYTSECIEIQQEWEQCIDFEAPPIDMMYYVTDTFTDSGATITILPFQWSNSQWTNGGSALIEMNGYAAGSGKEVWINNVNLSFEFPCDPSGLSLKFADLGGNLNIDINGDFRNFANFFDIHGAAIGGVSVSVIYGLSKNQGILTLAGEINHFAIGGQELAIDDVCPEIEGVEIFFSDAGEVPGSIYHYDPVIESETPIYTRPKDRLYSFCFSPWTQDKVFFVNANDSRIFVKDLSMGAPAEWVFYKHTTYARDIAFNSEGTLFFSESTGSSKDGKIWQLGKDGTVSLFYTVSLSKVGGFWAGYFTFDKDDKLYLSSGNQAPASIFRVDVVSDTVSKVYTDNNGAILGMVFDEDGFLYYADGRTQIYCLDLADGKRRVIYQNPSRTWLSDVSLPVTEIPSSDAEGIWIMPYGIGDTRLDQIKPSGLTDYTDGISGYYMQDAPFGARLGLRLGWANDIPTENIKYYRLQYKHESESKWQDFKEPVTVHYVKEAIGKTPIFPIYTLGPHDFDGKNLYEFRPHEEDLSSLVPVGPGEYVSWPQTGFLRDIYSGFLDTEAQHLAPGRYQIKVEVYDPDGNQVLPGVGTFDFVIPTGVDTDDTILTDIAAPGSIDAGGFVFTIHVDNRPCGAVIDEPMIGSEGAGDCGFLRYDPDEDPESPVHISFHATHPDHFALFHFRIVRGPHTVSTTVVNGSEVSSTSAGVYTGDANGTFEHDFLRSELLESCIEAAFAERLYVYAKATTGWRQRINKLDASALRAFALTPQ